VVYTVHTDHLNTPRVITDTSNTVVWRWDGEPFGSTMPDEDPDGDGVTVSFNQRFAGQYYDAESGLHYNYFRYYDPSTGRYVTSDPIGLGGGLNTYGYVGGNPTGYIDPRGDIAIAAGAGPIGLVVAVGCYLSEGCRRALEDIAESIAGVFSNSGDDDGLGADDLQKLSGGTGDYCSNNPEDPVCDTSGEPQSCTFGKNADKKIRKHINQVRYRNGLKQDIPSPGNGGNEMVRDIVRARVEQGGGVYRPYAGQPAYRYADGNVEYVIRPNGEFWTILRR